MFDGIDYKRNGLFSIKQGSIERDYKIEVKTETQNTIEKPTKKRFKLTRNYKKSGVTDTSGNIIIPFAYDKLDPINDDKFAFWKSDTTGIIDINQNKIYTQILPFTFEQAKLQRRFIPCYVPNKERVFLTKTINGYWLILMGTKPAKNMMGSLLIIKTL